MSKIIQVTYYVYNIFLQMRMLYYTTPLLSTLRWSRNSILSVKNGARWKKVLVTFISFIFLIKVALLTFPPGNGVGNWANDLLDARPQLCTCLEDANLLKQFILCLEFKQFITAEYSMQCTFWNWYEQLFCQDILGSQITVFESPLSVGREV